MQTFSQIEKKNKYDSKRTFILQIKLGSEVTFISERIAIYGYEAVVSKGKISNIVISL